MNPRSLALSLVLFLGVASSVSAHPGRTDAKGGHTCRTNCEKWGLKYGEYHYHNGGSSSGSSSSSSSSGSSSSSSKSGSTTPSESASALSRTETAISVKSPDFSVSINGQQIDNATSSYPVFVYKDITYFPMTWSYTQALGLETKWDADVGFVIRKTDNPASPLALDTGKAAGAWKAKLPSFSIFVNDAWVDNAKEDYPVLVMNDVTYFPMTWHYAVEELSLTTKFENNTFYISK
ncbi:YHYH domain-containing protein [Paenibacillus filicis]|uniref:YHYH domain-containing protein n=1 Tax=Paenibacillus filicis TaxID=669464 RepID=A0ABU9DDN7_9BACL